MSLDWPSHRKPRQRQDALEQGFEPTGVPSLSPFASKLRLTNANQGTNMAVTSCCHMRDSGHGMTRGRIERWNGIYGSR